LIRAVLLCMLLELRNDLRLLLERILRLIVHAAT